MHTQVYAYMYRAGKLKTALVEKEILKRYLDGTASSEEESLVHAWLADPSKRYEILDWIESYWTEHRMETGPVPTFEEVFGEALKAEKKEGKVIALHRSRKVWMYAAAACVVFFATGLWIGNLLKQEPEKNKWLLSKAQTGKGERTQLMLSDGSEVFLSPETELMIHQEVAAPPVVYLEGEAHFKMKDTSRSLVIKTKELVTTAKGSEINVSAFTKDSTVTVSVEQGNAIVVENNETTFPLIKLRLPRKKDTAAMPATLPLARIRPAKVKVEVNNQELMTFNKNNGNADVSARKDESDSALAFDNAGEREIVAKLKKWFGVQTFFTEPLEDNETYTGDYTKNATLQEVLSGISITLKQEVRIYGTTVYMIKKK